MIQNARALAAGILLAFLGSFGQTYFISIFAGEIRHTFDLSHGQWGGIYTLGTAASAIAMIWAGEWTDRLRARAIGAITLVFLALSCLAMALTPSAWVLPVVVFALRLAGQGMSVHVALVAMGRWFQASRGKAISVATLGGNAGEALLPLLFVALLAQTDWRVLWVVAACLALLGVPVLFTLLTREQPPESWTTTDESVGMQGLHWSRNQAFRHWLFWFIFPALIGPAAFTTAFFFHQVHFAAIKGWPHVDLVALFPGYMAVMIASMAIAGWLLDKIGTARLMPWIQLPMIVAFTLFAHGESLMIALIGLSFLALTSGANAVIPNAFWAEFYGTRNLGSIKAMATAVMVLGTALGPGLSGLLIDLGRGLEAQYQIAAGYFLVTTALMRIGIGRALKGACPTTAP
ncbi:MAG: MFS transporter [Ectothiorhodospiraceae bacterium]